MNNSSTNFPDSNYEVVKLPLNMGNRELFPDGRLAIYKHKKELKSCAQFYFEKKFHGPPQHVHGGAQAYILDEIMGSTGWMHGFSVVAKSINVEFLKPTPIETQLFGYGEVSKEEHPILHINAKICDNNGVEYSRSQGIFRILTQDKLGDFLPK